LSADAGAFRRRAVPAELVGAKNSRILDWARSELDGEEPSLDRVTLRRISSGELTDVVLRPRKAGFFGPDGTFIEAFEYQPQLGGDLDLAETKWETEENDRLWADAENGRFNRKVVASSGGSARPMWEHGQRIHEYSEQSGRPEWALLALLAKRRGEDGYAEYTHQTCLYLFRWKEQMRPDDPILDWSWILVDAIMRFSGDKRVREHLVRVLKETPLRGLSETEQARLLGIRNRVADRGLDREHLAALSQFRSALTECRTPGEVTIDGIITAIRGQGPG
jgi:hypothetical protein